MTKEIIYDDVFEAIRHLENANPVINLKDRETGHLVRNMHFNIMQMPDGIIGAFPQNTFIRYFRGENDDYDRKYPCIPSIYRVKKSDDIDEEGKRKSDYILIDKLRIVEFELVL